LANLWPTMPQLLRRTCCRTNKYLRRTRVVRRSLARGKARVLESSNLEQTGQLTCAACPAKNHVGKRGVYFISTHTSFRILLSFLRRLVCPLLRPIRSHPANGRRQAHTLRIRNRICATVWPTCYGHQLMIGIWGAGDGVSSFIRP